MIFTYDPILVIFSVIVAILARTPALILLYGYARVIRVSTRLC